LLPVLAADGLDDRTGALAHDVTAKQPVPAAFVLRGLGAVELLALAAQANDRGRGGRDTINARRRNDSCGSCRDDNSRWLLHKHTHRLAGIASSSHAARDTQSHNRQQTGKQTHST